jgi:hypothetical protein
VNCRRTRSLLSAYIDAELTGFEMLQIRDHISRCEECSAEHKSLVSIKRLLSALPDKEPRQELIFHLQDLSPRRAQVGFAAGFRATSMLTLASAALMPTGGRRLASAIAFSLMGIWLMVAPAANAPQSMSLFARVPAHASRLLDMVRYSGPYSFSSWRDAASDPPIVDPLGRPVAVQDAHLASLQDRFLAETRAASLKLMTKPAGDDAFAPRSDAPGFGVSNMVFTGYSVPSR